MRYIFVCCLALLASIPVFAHGSSSSAGEPGDPKSVDRVVDISADDIKFDVKTMTVRSGETVKFVITNRGVLSHEFVIGDKAEQNEHEKEMQAMAGMQHQDSNAVNIKPGETQSLIWKFGAAGVVEYACHVPGHFAAGMVGTILVR